jgi:uncharacterized protein
LYISRKIDAELELWKKEKNAKPLLVRGARQVGKSTAIRKLATLFPHFLEINFEEQRQVHKVFEGDLDPVLLCETLSALYQVPIIPGETLLFFDEIQACIPAISSLRFFHEKYPALHVIAAGSLLEFALEEIPSFGVGRIRSMFVYPLSFNEYLDAVGERGLLSLKAKATTTMRLPEPVHQKLIQHVKRFLVLGGMPEVVATYVAHKDLNRCSRILDDLVTSLKADFAKYNKHVPYLRIAEVFDSVVQQSGGKFVYTKSATESNYRQIKEAVDLLAMGGLVITVTHTSANGIPLGAEVNARLRKLLLLDTGVFQRLLQLNIGDLLIETDFDLVNKGAIAEQYVGLELLKASSCYRQEELFYWHREAKSSNAEVDYVVQKSGDVIPLEVKSGKKGSMRSINIFMEEKKSRYGVRFSLENYSAYDNIRIYPLYAVGDWYGQSQ